MLLHDQCRLCQKWESPVYNHWCRCLDQQRVGHHCCGLLTPWGGVEFIRGHKHSLGVGGSKVLRVVVDNEVAIGRGAEDLSWHAVFPVCLQGVHLLLVTRGWGHLMRHAFRLLYGFLNVFDHHTILSTPGHPACREASDLSIQWQLAHGLGSGTG